MQSYFILHIIAVFILVIIAVQSEDAKREKWELLAAVPSSQEIIDYFNNALYRVYEKKKDSVQDTFVCLNPEAKQYGGWGNVVFYAFTLLEVSLALERVPVMNHALMTGDVALCVCVCLY